MTKTNKLIAGLFALSLAACSKVESGHVGVKVYTLGSDKGDIEVLGMGRYWIGMNEELHLFPVFQQNYTWTKVSEDKDNPEPDESISFQTVEGMEVNADIGISFHLDQTKIGDIFKTYRRGVDEITDTFLRNHVRDALNAAGSKLQVESVYGSGKTELMAQVEKTVKDQVAPIGIVVDKIYLIGSFRLPEKMVTALNSKMEATQRAQQRQNEVAEANAEAEKKVANAKGEAESKRLLAEAEANANKTVAQSLTSELVQYEYVKKWDGKLPTTSLGSSTPVIFNAK